ncbi:hypothetical protein Leryth_017052 [Lithospermum erythrorhizon]|nr:hypothetical protein Leryth_017052 [Lithospermum erythrorhizon]
MRKGRHFLHTITNALKKSKMEPSHRYSYNPTLKWNSEVEEYFINAYGAEHFALISQALTRPSCYTCIRVNTQKATSDAVIQKLLTILHETKQECTSVSKCDLPGLDYVVFVNGSGPHSIEYGYNEDKSPKEILVSRKCAEAVMRGAQVYVPGVLACSAHVEEGDVVAVSVATEQPNADGGWGIGITRGTVLQGSEADPYHTQRHGLYIGKGVSMLSRAGMFRASNGIAVDMNDRVFKLPSFNELLEGEIFLQNLPSIITAHALDPQPGERILDMCAAPGGKTTAIAILMKDEGEIIAVDRSHNKVLDIVKRAAEMGLRCITTYKLDALKAVRQQRDPDELETLINTNAEKGSPNANSAIISGEDLSDNGMILPEVAACNNQLNNGKYCSKADIRKNNRRMKNGTGRNHVSGGRVEKCQGFFPNSFDRVLLDAPCSALGLRPRLFAAELTMESLRQHAKYQRKMFNQAVQLVRPGGVLVYSTCTINPGENEALVRYALDTYKFLSLAPQHPRVGGPGLVGRCVMSDGYIDEWLRSGEEDLVQRFDPSSSLDTIGFFIAKFDVGPKI